MIFNFNSLNKKFILKILLIIWNLILMTSMMTTTHMICTRIPGLRPQQKRICDRKPQSLPIIINGLRMASQECQRQFLNHRWNCSSLNGHNIFTHHILRGTKEASIFYAIRCAGVTFAITQACSRGDISFCSCHQIDSKFEGSDWKWSGCNPNVNYGIEMTKNFMDSQDFKRNSRSLMNLHNNNAGRKSIRHLLISRCKCHGVSGSCSARTCWKTLPSFTAIGDHLMKKYKYAKQVVLHINSKSGSKAPLFLKLRQISSNEREMQSLPKSRDLVFLQKSDNYCNKNPLTDSLGTSGRICSKWSKGSDGCESMCCGRGYKTQKSLAKWKCGCIFHFCCRVECRQCSHNIEQYLCK